MEKVVNTNMIEVNTNSFNRTLEFLGNFKEDMTRGEIVNYFKFKEFQPSDDAVLLAMMNKNIAKFSNKVYDRIQNKNK